MRNGEDDEEEKRILRFEAMPEMRREAGMGAGNRSLDMQGRRVEKQGGQMTGKHNTCG